jgi:hypothetical protein
MHSAPTYFLSWDTKTQIATVVTDDLHRVIWGRMTYGNRPFNRHPFDAELVTPADPIAWIKAQMACRVTAAAEARRNHKALIAPAQSVAA